MLSRNRPGKKENNNLDKDEYFVFTCIHKVTTIEMHQISKTTKNAHTLLELLVVISIIGILAGLVTAGVTAMVRNAKKADAENTALNLRNAISAYYTEYRRFPVPKSVSQEDDYLDFATNEEFMAQLLGGSPRGIPIFSGRSAKRLKSDTFINGLALNDDGSGNGSLWDPWGNLYGVRIDITNRQNMPNPERTPPNLSGDAAPKWGSGQSNAPKYISESLVVWSQGKEAELSSDNVTTW